MTLSEALTQKELTVLEAEFYGCCRCPQAKQTVLICDLYQFLVGRCPYLL